ncbi:MAG: zf-HC2 domain-containing protein [Myxococcaceae bacterium]|nr:zf-HC2 domain-containing protein [Myxococcaceae bacterium]
MSAPATHVDDLLLDFAYGELSEREAKAVQAHLSSCAQCQASLDEIQGVRRVMAKLPPAEAPKDGLDSLLAYAEQAARRVQAGPAPKKAWWRALILPLGGVTAAAIFFIVGQKVTKDESLREAAHHAAVAKVSGETADALAPAPPPVAPSPEPTVPAESAAKDEAFAAVPKDVAAAERTRPDAKVSMAGAPKGRVAESTLEVPKKKAAPSPSMDHHVAGFGPPGGSGSIGLAQAGDGSAALGRGAAAHSRSAGGAGFDAEVPVRATARMKADVPAVADKDAKAEAMPAPTPAVTGTASAPRTVAMDGLQVEDALPAAASEAEVDDRAVREAREERKPALRDAEAKALLDQALAANRARRFAEAIRACQAVLALSVGDARIRQGALNALCEAQSELSGDLSACEVLVRDYPSSGAASVARNRIASFRARTGPAATGAPAPRPPYATEKRAAQPARAAPEDAADPTAPRQ